MGVHAHIMRTVRESDMYAMASAFDRLEVLFIAIIAVQNNTAVGFDDITQMRRCCERLAEMGREIASEAFGIATETDMSFEEWEGFQ